MCLWGFTNTIIVHVHVPMVGGLCTGLHQRWNMLTHLICQDQRANPSSTIYRPTAHSDGERISA